MSRTPAALRTGVSIRVASPRKSQTAVPLLLMQCAALKLPTPVTEYIFHPTRKWRLDAAWPDHRIAVEVDGGGFINGRHSRGAGMEEDAIKYAEATLRGWRIFRTTPRQVKAGTTVAWLERAFLQVPSPPTSGVPHVASR